MFTPFHISMSLSSVILFNVILKRDPFVMIVLDWDDLNAGQLLQDVALPLRTCPRCRLDLTLSTISENVSLDELFCRPPATLPNVCPGRHLCRLQPRYQQLLPAFHKDIETHVLWKASSFYNSKQASFSEQKCLNYSHVIETCFFGRISVRVSRGFVRSFMTGKGCSNFRKSCTDSARCLQPLTEAMRRSKEQFSKQFLW